MIKKNNRKHKKKSWSNWTFSNGGSAMFMSLFFIVVLLKFIRLFSQNSDSITSIIMLLLVLVLFFTMLWFFGIKHLAKKELWRIPRTWYEGFFGFGLMQAFYAILVAVTGKLPVSNHHFVPVDKTVALEIATYALIFITIGFIAFAIEKRSKSK